MTRTRMKTIEREDGKARVVLYRDDRGLFSFVEEHELEDDVPGIGRFSYWAAVYESGLHADRLSVEREARASVRWLEASIK